MDIRADLTAPCDATTLYAWVDDLARYPSWMPLVHRAEVEPDGSAWAVELRGRVGPFARSKRLRMRRTVHEPDARVQFERDELDGRRHSPWVLDVVLAPAEGGGTQLEMQLHYGGRLWNPVLERILHDQIEQGRDRLLSLVSAG